MQVRPGDEPGAATGFTIPRVSDQLPELRASDSDRERTVEVLSRRERRELREAERQRGG
jgi:hypothetical protein